MDESLNIAERLTPKRGRDVRTESMATRFTTRELKTLSDAAAADGKTVREWARDVLLECARRPPDDVLMTELVATRLLLLNLLKPLAMGKVLNDQEFAAISSSVQQNKRKVTREIQSQYTSRAASEA
jgi:hypothetical protein